MKVTVGKPYWVNLHFDGDAGTVSGAVFDPANGFAQVGTTMVAQVNSRGESLRLDQVRPDLRPWESSRRQVAKLL